MARIGKYGCDRCLFPIRRRYVPHKLLRQFKNLEKIRAVIETIELQMCENVVKNFINRAWSCKRSRGDHINDIVFHY